MIKAELLQDATEAIIQRLTFDDRWVFQEKFNGERRLIEKRGDGTVWDYNRDGDPGKGLPRTVKTAIRNHPLYQFVIDVELVGEVIHLFDALALGDEMIAVEPQSYRESSYHAQFDGYHSNIVPVHSARTTEEKIALRIRLKQENAEGLVAEDSRAPYRPADNNRRFNYRLKDWKDLDAVVIGDSRERDAKGMLKSSVRLGCFDEKGVLHDICGATKKSRIPVSSGDVVKVSYLYGTANLNIVQIDILEKRYDKRAEDCMLDQIVVNKNWKRGRK